MPEGFLRDSKGYLVSDAYQGYEKVEGTSALLLLGTCEDILWRHCLKISKARKPPLKIQAIEYCKELFKIEDEISDEEAKTRYKIRQEKARPIL